MNVIYSSRLLRILFPCVCLLGLGGNVVHAQSPPLSVSFFYPSNGQAFLAPANIALYAQVTDSNVVQTVQFFSGTASIGNVTNTGGVLLGNPGTTRSPFYMVWSNVPAGTYTLTAVATDSASNTATSAPVTISVTNVPPPPNVPFVVSFWYPTNGEAFLAPATIGVHAQVTDSNIVETVQYFSGAASIGIVTNARGVLLTNISTDSPFYMAWSNVPAGTYTLTAVATDSASNTATSAPVTISVTNVPPPVVRPSVYIYSPTNGAIYHGPTNLTLYARAVENNGTVAFVQFFAGRTNLGVVSNASQGVFTNVSSEPLFPLVWSNVPVGAYALCAVATDTQGNAATSSVVNISVISNSPPPSVPFAVSFYYPSNGQMFLAPAAVGMHADVTDSNVVETVQYFSGAASIGIVTNTNGVLLTNTGTANPFFLAWSNVPAGKYVLTAVATDSAGNTATSAPVAISVTNAPPPSVPFAISLLSPSNRQAFLAPASIGLQAVVADSNVVQTVQYFSGAASIGIVTNTGGMLLTNATTRNPFYMVWSNVPAGTYTLTAVATDSASNTATSAPVTISVTNTPPPPNVPFAVSFYYPSNGEAFLAPATIGVHAQVTDSNVVETVQYFSGAASIGIVTNTRGVLLTNTSTANPFFMAWSNVAAGSYTLTAVATDSASSTATSAPVAIRVTNAPPVVRIYAPDPVAVEGTNTTNWFPAPNVPGNYCSGSNTATFLVRRDSGTNAALTVYYSIGGTASNGLDYAAIPNNVTIPAGQSYALITIVPLNDDESAYRDYDTVVLTLTAPTNTPPPYSIGSPSVAGAIILEEDLLPIVPPTIRNLSDSSKHVSLPATNGMSFSLQISADLVNWLPVCTNTVLKGSAQFLDPGSAANPNLFYRIAPAGPPSY
jgi:uncharacterized metal-binding protein